MRALLVLLAYVASAAAGLPSYNGRFSVLKENDLQVSVRCVDNTLRAWVTTVDADNNAFPRYDEMMFMVDGMPVTFPAVSVTGACWHIVELTWH